jgi:hypothetical protein
LEGDFSLLNGSDIKLVRHCARLVDGLERSREACISQDATIAPA